MVDFGTGPAVLLLHGFPDSRFLWRYQLPALAAAGFRVIAPDLRGFGDAPRPTAVRPYRRPFLAADVLGLLDALGVQRAHLVGHDWGAALTWRLAGSYPERFDRVVVLISRRARQSRLGYRSRSARNRGTSISSSRQASPKRR